MDGQNLKGMPICQPNDHGTAINLVFRDEDGRDHSFNVHPTAIQEIILKLASAAEHAAELRGELTTPDGRPIVRALVPEKFGVRLPEDESVVFLTLFPLDLYPLDFALSAEAADSIGGGLMTAAAKVQAAQKARGH